MRTVRLSLSHTVLAAVLATLVAPPEGRAYSITSFGWGEPISFELADGRRIEGRFHGTLGAATGPSYAERYAAWLDDVGPTSAPALGETLLVARASEAPLRGAFAGFAGGDLLLATTDSCSFLVVPVSGNNVRRTDEPTMNSDWIAARALWKSAPSPYAFVVETDDGSLAVPAAAIVSSTPAPDCGASRSGGGGGGGGVVVAAVLLGVLVGGLVAYAAIGAAFASAFSHMLI